MKVYKNSSLLPRTSPPTHPSYNLDTTLLVNVAVTFALLAGLEETGDAEDKNGVDACIH